MGYLDILPLDPWNGDAPMILTESRSLAGVLRALVRDHCALIAPTNGQTAGFLHNEVAPMLHDGQRVGYLGDYDLAGNDIEENTRSVLERKTGFTLKWERLALTREQVEDPRYRLTPIIKYDRRFKNGGAHEAVETEALSQRVVRDWFDALPAAAARRRSRTRRGRAGSLAPDAEEGVRVRLERWFKSLKLVVDCLYARRVSFGANEGDKEPLGFSSKVLP